jgi:hypothetical protein
MVKVVFIIKNNIYLQFRNNHFGTVHFGTNKYVYKIKVL